MYQKIVCGNCGETIIEFFGDAWIDDGWVQCKCGFETKVSAAIPSSENRRIANQKAGLPNRKPSSVRERYSAESTSPSVAPR